ncbi:phospholipase D-like domain-containing protein [Anoxybacteroides rupiense]|uniref:phospholipase D-like domain-containing protein n=1 Tax=Anoxybacteroides rupiense TaxID=311460 RepID=UPI0016069ED9|nr:phospholipase D-like domain-containing protein [Anoxybacillus rupiensis]MBB3907324.1 phosphatidylserine/phosphatidylglycerophosphate/cardiolipin synthase-like enzyme [Anoxybacillus rupiensis]
MFSEKSLFKLNVLYQKLEGDILPNINSSKDLDLYSHLIQAERIFQELFPNLSVDEVRNLLLLLKIISNRSKEGLHRVEIVSSGIPNTNIPIRETVGVIRQLLFEASQYIGMTGYAISPYFHQLSDLLEHKGRQGVTLEIFIENNHNENLKYFLEHLNIENLKVYKYNNTSRHSALHAKTIVVDYRVALITSANLSYNGMINNIEIGALIEGKQVENIVKIFEELKTRGLFESIN